MITSSEAVWLYLLSGLIVVILLKNTFHKNALMIWSPLSVVAAIYLYYCVVGPYLSIVLDTTYYRLIDHRPFYELGWKGAFLSLLALSIGHIFTVYRVPIAKAATNINQPNSYIKWRKYMLWVALIGSILSFGLSGLGTLTGGRLEHVEAGGSFSNYIFYTINFFIPVLAWMFLDWLNGRQKFWQLALLCIYVIAIYLALGFRYRIVLLFGSFFIIYHIVKNRKPNFAFLSVVLVVFIGLMGFIQMTRNYHTGLVISDEVAQADMLSFILAGMEESAVFQTSSLLIASVPEYAPFLHFQFIIESIAMPIPRILWPGKPSGEELEFILGIYDYRTGKEDVGTGAAVLNYAEAFLAFGWLGLIGVSFVWGVVFGKVWNFFLENRYNDLAIILFVIFNTFIYVIISRGYLPQVTFTFFFTVFPLIWLWRKKKKAVYA